MTIIIFIIGWTALSALTLAIWHAFVTNEDNS